MNNLNRIPKRKIKKVTFYISDGNKEIPLEFNRWVIDKLIYFAKGDEVSIEDSKIKLRSIPIPQIKADDVIDKLNISFIWRLRELIKYRDKKLTNDAIYNIIVKLLLSIDFDHPKKLNKNFIDNLMKKPVQRHRKAYLIKHKVHSEDFRKYICDRLSKILALTK